MVLSQARAMTKVRLERPGTVSFVGDRAATPGAIADGLRSTTQEECEGKYCERDGSPGRHDHYAGDYPVLGNFRHGRGPMKFRQHP